jgi:hypothetical protein
MAVKKQVIPPQIPPAKDAASETGIDNYKPKAVSVYLSKKDLSFLEEIARKNNVNRHMLLSYSVRYFLANFRAGHIKLDPTIQNGRVVLNVNIDLNDKKA